MAAPSQVEVELIAADASCSLCGLSCGPHPLEQQVAGAALAFCCLGCMNVHAILRESGVLKPGVDPRETELFQKSLAMGLVSTREPRSKSAAPADPAATRERMMRVSGMWCGACAWLIEHTLGKLQGVANVEVYFASDLLKVQYDPRFVPPGTIEAKVQSLGYRLSDVDELASQSEADRKDLLLRLGVA